MLSRGFTATYHCGGSKKHELHAFYSPSCGIIPDMQPESNRPAASGIEQQVAPPVNTSETVPSAPSVDSRLERGQERVEQAAEGGARVSDAAAFATSMATPVVPVQQDPPQVAPPPTTSTTPLVAGDEDLIEKEWVDKAKEIIEQTKDDPHARTQKVNELQRDYLQKRYGKVVGASE